MNEVRRFTHKLRLSDFVIGQPAPMPAGDYVLASDYDALAAQLAAAEELNRVAALGMSELEQRLAEAQARVRELEAAKDGAYLERNHLVAALARCFPSGIRKTAIEGWSGDWHGCVYIDLPAGQISYHYHDSQAGLFKDLSAYTKPWDGHTTEEKYARLARLIPLEQQVARLRESSNDLVEFFTQNHEDVGEELYGRVNGKDLTPSAKRLNEMLTEMQQALRETGALKEDATMTAHHVSRATAEQVEYYIRMADAELGQECCNDWVEDIRQFLRTQYITR